MKKLIKSTIAFYLILNTTLPVSSSHAGNINSKNICANECFQKDYEFEYISRVANSRDTAPCINDDTELDWYYVSKGKNQIPEGPKESIDFLKENSAYYLGDTSKKVLYLTFDEGHDNENTPKILDILKEFNVPATFFIPKSFIDSYPDQVKRMVAEGHIVGNHGTHHLPVTRIHDKEIFASELSGISDAYKALIGQDMPKLFRPPMWKYSKESLQMTKNLGYKTIFWSFAFKDWLENQFPESYVIDKIITGAHPGAIMLLHAVSDTDTKVLATVIKDLKLEGYEFKSLNDLPADP